MSIIPKSNNMIKGTRPGHLNWFNFKIWWKGNWKSLGRLYLLFFYFIFSRSPIPMLSIPGADSEWEWVLRLRRSSRARPSYLPAAETQPAINQLSSPSLSTPSLGGESCHLGPELDNADTLVPIWICVMVRGRKTKAPLWVCCHHTWLAGPFQPETMSWWKNADMFNID